MSELTTPFPTNDNMHSLSPEQQEQLEAILITFPSSEPGRLGKTSVLEHSINVMIMFDELERMLELGVIEESQSPWNSPVVLVRKSNGKARLCLDSRVVNTVTVTQCQ